MEKKRLDFIDYARAVVILTVITEHIGYEGVGWFAILGMAIFYFCSGYTYTDKQKPLKEMIFVRFKKLILPFWGCLTVSGIFEIWRSWYFHYSDFRIAYLNLIYMIYGSGYKVPLISGLTDVALDIFPYYQDTSGFVSVITPTNCHLWFLPAMFTGQVLFIIYMRYVKKRGIWDALAIAALLSLSYIESLQNFPQFPFGLGRGFVAFSCMLAGVYIKKFDIFTLNKRGYFTFAISTLITVIMHISGADEMYPVMSFYGFDGLLGVYLCFISMVSFTIAFLYLFLIIENKVHFRLWLYIGRNTMTIYLWHLPFLTLYSMLFAKIFGIEVEPFRYHMSLISLDHWGILLAVVALTVATCLLIEFAKQRITHHIKEM